MKWIAALSVSLCVLGLADSQDKKEKADDVKKLQGKWEMVEGERPDGEKFDENFIKGFKLTLDGEKYDAKLADGSGEEGTYKANAKDDPKTLEFTVGGGDVRKAIFKFDGEQLKLCVSDRGGERPKDFAGKDGNVYLILKKSK